MQTVETGRLAKAQREGAHLGMEKQRGQRGSMLSSHTNGIQSRYPLGS